MTNRAQVTTPYNVDMFTTLPAGHIATFTDENSPTGYYNVTPDNSTTGALVIPIPEFNKHFKYYIQSMLNL